MIKLNIHEGIGTLKIKINDNNREIDLSLCNTLRKLVETILRDEISPDSVVHQIILNGTELTEEQISNIDAISIKEIETLEIFTATPKELSFESIRIAAGQLTEVVEETKKTADFFRYKDESEANQRFVILIEIFQKFLSLLELLKKTLQLDFSAITTEDKSLGELQNDMMEILSLVLASQENKDWITLADLLEFELAPLLNTWSKVIPTLACPSDGEPN